MLPGGLGRFVPCSLGAHDCRLRHVCWERCSHGLTSRPHGECLWSLFRPAFAAFFTTLPRLLVHCLQVLFPYGIVLLSLPLVPLFGLCPFLVMLLG